MEVTKELVDNIASQIKAKIPFCPTVAIILGSGLSSFVDEMENKIIVRYQEIAGMPFSNVEGHKNQFVFGKLGGKYIVAMQGRFHPYDGFSAKECGLPVYVFNKLGVKTLIVTNSAGAINQSYNVGDLVLIKDHINLTAQNPMINGSILDGKVRFVDLKQVYDKNYLQVAENLANKLNIKTHKGVYIQVIGPTYETPAEVKFFRTIGSDVVAMSTVLEVISACDCGMKVLGISCVANKAVSEDEKEVLSHKEVLESGVKATENLKNLIGEFLKEI